MVEPYCKILVCAHYILMSLGLEQQADNWIKMYHSASTPIGLIILSLCLWKHCWASIEESDDFLLNTFDQDHNSQELLESNDTNNLELGPDLDNSDGKFTYLFRI